MGSSPIVIFLKAGLMGQIIIFILLMGSIYATAIWLDKRKLLNNIVSLNDVFKKNYLDSGNDFDLFLKNQMWRHWEIAPLPRIYQKAAREVQLYLSETNFAQSSSVATSSKKLTLTDIESLEKLIEREISEELTLLQSSLHHLATIASVAPLAGLLGTVWGIMVTFIEMSHQGNANISTVAPGVSQALITTIFGLVVAIPALISYNNFNHRINAMAVEMQNFMSSFVSKIERRFLIS